MGKLLPASNEPFQKSDNQAVFDPTADVSAGILAAALLLLAIGAGFILELDLGAPLSALVLVLQASALAVTALLALASRRRWFMRHWRRYSLASAAFIVLAYAAACLASGSIKGYSYTLALISLTVSTLVPLGGPGQALTSLGVLLAYTVVSLVCAEPPDGYEMMRWFTLLVSLTLSQTNAMLVDRYRRSLRRQFDLLHQAAGQRERQIAMMGHDIRGPLAIISGYLDLLEDEDLSEPEKTLMKGRISHAVKAIDGMVANLLDLYRFQEGRLEAHPRSVNANSVVARVADEWSKEAAKRKLDLQIRLAQLPDALLDPLHLERIMTNLLSNAIKFTENGRIAVETARLAGAFTVVVSDTGAGIPARLIPQIFNRFQPPSQRSDSVGLGLYISRILAEAGGGSIAVKSTEGRGSQFTVTFPLIEQPKTPREEPLRLEAKTGARAA